MNTLTPHFTIVTVTFNCQELIEKTVISVLDQQFVDYEYIIVDGQSNDATMKVIDKYRNKIATIVSEPDSGIYDAMNKAVKLARGEWVLFLNAGDVFCNDAVLATVGRTTCDTDVDVVYGDIELRQGSELAIKRAKEPCNLQRMYFCHQSAFTRRRQLEGSPFDLRYRLSADFDFYKKLYYRGARFRHLNLPIVIYDMEGLSNQQRVSGLTENLKIVRKLDRGSQRMKFSAKLLFVINRVRFSNFLKSVRIICK